MGFTEGIGKSSYVVNNVDLNFGSEDFCIEGWCFPKGAPGVEVTSPSNHDTLKTTKLFGLYNMAGSINRRSYIVYKENSGGQGIRGIVSGDGLYDADTGNTDPNINMAWEEWNHFALEVQEMEPEDGSFENGGELHHASRVLIGHPVWKAP